jgi:hypothetical protein
VPLRSSTRTPTRFASRRRLRRTMPRRRSSQGARSWHAHVGLPPNSWKPRPFAYGFESTDAGLILFLLPGGRPRRFAGTAAIQAGGLPRRRPPPLANRSRLTIASSICSCPRRNSARIFATSIWSRDPPMESTIAGWPAAAVRSPFCLPIWNVKAAPETARCSKAYRWASPLGPCRWLRRLERRSR